MSTYRAYRAEIDIIRKAIMSCEAARSLYSAEAEVIAIAVHEALERHRHANGQPAHERNDNIDEPQP